MGDRNLRLLLADGLCSETLGALTGGAFLIAFALYLDASHIAIGVISAAIPATQLLQLPAVLYVERRGHRKPIAVAAAYASRALWFAPGLVLLLPAPLRVPALIALLTLSFALSALWKTAFSPWIRDLVPGDVRGRYFARRLALSTGVAAVASLAAGLWVERGAKLLGNAAAPYLVVFAAAGVVGIIGATVLSRISEPPMEPAPKRAVWWDVLREPLSDPQYRRVLAFLGTWSFAINFAAPFFMVYMLERIGLSIGAAVVMTVLSQLVNVWMMRAWGVLVDRLGDRGVLALSTTMFLVTLLVWPFTTLADSAAATWTLLIAIHCIAGIANAGVTLSSTTLALAAAPRGRSTAYLAARGIVAAAPATVAPLIAGLLADALADHRLSVALRWTNYGTPAPPSEVTTLALQGLDFLFIGAFLFGLYALHRLFLIPGTTQTERTVVLAELYGEVRKVAVSSVAGLRHLSALPDLLSSPDPGTAPAKESDEVHP